MEFISIFQEQYCWNEQFTFSLICKVEQKVGSQLFYSTENDQQMAEVPVDVRGSSPKVAVSAILLTISTLFVMNSY